MFIKKNKIWRCA